MSQAIAINQMNNVSNISSLQYQFIAYVDASPKTIDTYKKALKRFFRWLDEQFIKLPLREDIIKYRDMLKSLYKPTTVQTYIVAVRRFFQWTELEGLYKDIAKNIKGAKLGRDHKKDALTTSQMKDILNTVKKNNTLQSLRDYAIIATAVTGGLRTIELQRANIEDIRTLGDNTVLYIQGKGRDEKSEYIKLTPIVEKAIREYLNARGVKSVQEPLFASVSNRNNGGRVTTRSISRLIKNAFIKAGYSSDRLTAHSLRHTAGTLNLINGGSLEETQQLLRHSNINTTMIYLHHLERANNKSEERIASAIF